MAGGLAADGFAIRPTRNARCYMQARDAMFAATDTDCAPWHVIEADEKRHARLAVMRVILGAVDYGGKDERLVAR